MLCWTSSFLGHFQVIEGTFGSWRNVVKEGFSLEEYFEVSKKHNLIFVNNIFVNNIFYSIQKVSNVN